MKKTNRKTTKPTKENKQGKRVVTLDDVALTHVAGGVANAAFCTTPWD